MLGQSRFRVFRLLPRHGVRHRRRPEHLPQRQHREHEQVQEGGARRHHDAHHVPVHPGVLHLHGHRRGNRKVADPEDDRGPRPLGAAREVRPRLDLQRPCHDGEPRPDRAPRGHERADGDRGRQRKSRRPVRYRLLLLRDAAQTLQLHRHRHHVPGLQHTQLPRVRHPRKGREPARRQEGEARRGIEGEADLCGRERPLGRPPRAGHEVRHEAAPHAERRLGAPALLDGREHPPDGRHLPLPGGPAGAVVDAVFGAPGQRLRAFLRPQLPPELAEEHVGGEGPGHDMGAPGAR
mmetsp:Transcript_35865/g.100918  ORF Transcript_35865/g.100918 Transcript_35865/m.100918 type:complete len:293 (-) Transcript_35865:441-1319(-)